MDKKNDLSVGILEEAERKMLETGHKHTSEIRM